MQYGRIVVPHAYKCRLVHANSMYDSFVRSNSDAHQRVKRLNSAMSRMFLSRVPT